MGPNARARGVILCLAAVMFLGPGVLRAEEGWRALGPVGVAGNEGLAGRVISRMQSLPAPPLPPDASTR